MKSEVVGDSTTMIDSELQKARDGLPIVRASSITVGLQTSPIVQPRRKTMAKRLASVSTTRISLSVDEVSFVDESSQAVRQKEVP